MKVAVVGAGMMGERIARAAARAHLVAVHDQDATKAKELAARVGWVGCRAATADDAVRSDIVVLSLPATAVVPFIRQHADGSPPGTVWVNTATFATRELILEQVGAAREIVSAKIVGHAEMIERGERPVIVLDPSHTERESVRAALAELFSGFGEVVWDREDRYLDVNLIAADLAMKGTLELARRLRDKGCPPSVVSAAASQVFVGTARQFPYRTPDYFHEHVLRFDASVQALWDDHQRREAAARSMEISS